MNPATMIKEAAVEGVRLNLSAAGKLIATGQPSVVNRWLPIIREMKTEIAAELQRINELAVEANTANSKISSHWWRIYYPNGVIKETAYCPSATHADALGGEPDAIRMESFEPIRRQPVTPLTRQDEAAILAWLGRIGETDKDTILDVLNSCRTNAEARASFIREAQQS
jgi:hypothetical protein